MPEAPTPPKGRLSCAMCMSAIYWSRIDHVYFAASLEDTSKIGFDDAFQSILVSRRCRRLVTEPPPDATGCG